MATMHALSARLEALSMRERVMLLVGLPVALIAVAESLVFSPARVRAAVAQKQIQSQEVEFKALSDLLAKQPTLSALPAVDQLQRQRDELIGQIDSSRRVVEGLGETVDWGTVVRAAVAGTPGLTLTQLKTQAPEVVFSPAQAQSATKAGNGAASGPPRTAVSATSATANTPSSLDSALSIYRHRADLTVQGDLAALMGYLQTLQQVPGALHWERLQLTVNEYPRATVQMTLYTLSDRAQTPFN